MSALPPPSPPPEPKAPSKWWRYRWVILGVAVGAPIVVSAALSGGDDDEPSRGGGSMTMCEALDGSSDLSSSSLKALANDLLDDLPTARRNVAVAQILTVCPEYAYVLD